jgi:TonB family protein
MQIGFSGRVGIGIMFLSAAADGATWVVRAVDGYPFDFYRLSDAYLPLVFLFGLASFLPSLVEEMQRKRAAELAQFPLTTAGPLPAYIPDDFHHLKMQPALQQPAQQVEEILPPALVFTPMPSWRAYFNGIGKGCVLAAIAIWGVTHFFSAGLGIAGLADTMSLFIFALAGIGFALIMWPEVRETEELSLQGERRATFRGMASVDRSLPVFIPFSKSHYPRRTLTSAWIAAWVGVMMIVMIILRIIIVLHPNGLIVHLSRPGVDIHHDDPWHKPLVVYVDADSNYYLQSRPVPPSQLASELKAEFSVRPDWSIYVDANSDAHAGNAFQIADVVRGFPRARVFLVTPSLEKENPGLFVEPPCLLHPVELATLPQPPRKTRTQLYTSTVSFIVSDRGTIFNARILKSSTDAEIDLWAINTVGKWKYAPRLGCGSTTLERTFTAYYWEYGP